MDACKYIPLIKTLAKRRKQLQMTWVALAKRSKLSRATVIHLLQGRSSDFSFLHVVAIAEAMGVEIELTSRETDPVAFATKEAERHAQRLVRMLQGTMGLEAQGLSQAAASELVEKTRLELVSHSWKNLWFE